MKNLFAEIRVLANNPHLGNINPQYGTKFKFWSTLVGQYNIFFKRPKTDTLRIVMIRSTTEPLPTLTELRKANK
jgi:plasmid stabilization system protein ParE